MNFSNFQSMLATPTILVILLMKLMAIRVDPFRVFFSKMKRSLVIQKAHCFFRCGFLELFMWVTSFDWFCSRNIENISWSMNSMDESLWFLEMLHNFYPYWNARGKLTSESSPLTLFFVSFCLSSVSSLRLFFSMQKKLQTYHDHHNISLNIINNIKNIVRKWKRNNTTIKFILDINTNQNKEEEDEEEEEEEQQQQWWWQWTILATITSSIFNQTQLLCPKESFLKILEDAVCSLDIVQEFLGLPLVAESEKFPRFGSREGRFFSLQGVSKN